MINGGYNMKNDRCNLGLLLLELYSENNDPCYKCFNHLVHWKREYYR